MRRRLCRRWARGYAYPGSMSASPFGLDYHRLGWGCQAPGAAFEGISRRAQKGESGLDLAWHVGSMVYPVIRQHPRFPLRLPVLCESPAVAGYRTVGLTHNVSQGGLLLEVPQPLAPGTPMSLLMCTGDQNARAEAVVVWAVEDQPSRMGLRLTTLAESDRLAWDQFLAFQGGPTPRASVRIPIALEVTLRIPPDIRVTARVDNISDGGLLLGLSEGISPQTQLTVAVPPWLTFPAVETEMEVVWTRDAPGEQGVLHGLRFSADDISKELFLIGILLRQIVVGAEAEVKAAGYLRTSDPLR